MGYICSIVGGTWLSHLPIPLRPGPGGGGGGGTPGTQRGLFKYMYSNCQRPFVPIPTDLVRGEDPPIFQSYEAAERA